MSTEQPFDASDFSGLKAGKVAREILLEGNPMTLPELTLEPRARTVCTIAITVILVPNNPPCDICGSPATVEVHDSLNNKDHLYCSAHKPDLWPGRKNPKLSLLRYRSDPNSSLSRMWSAPEETAEHQSFREEMCESQLLGAEGACRYYLSALTNSDQFALWQDEFVASVREFIVGRTAGAAASIPFDSYTIGFMLSFLKSAYEAVKRPDRLQQSKHDRAIELLLNHPSWSDAQIAKNVPTTVKQIERNSDFQALRSAISNRRTYETREAP
jgi:hypothetical protein